jgi:hypothetical protein
VFDLLARLSWYLPDWVWEHLPHRLIERSVELDLLLRWGVPLSQLQFSSSQSIPVLSRPMD